MTHFSPRRIAALAAAITLAALGVAAPATAAGGQPTITLSPSSGLLTDTAVETSTDLVCPNPSINRFWFYLTTTEVTSRATFARSGVTLVNPLVDSGILFFDGASYLPDTTTGTFPTTAEFPVSANPETQGNWTDETGNVWDTLANLLQPGEYSLVAICASTGAYNPLALEDLGGGSYGATMAWTHITVGEGGTWQAEAGAVAAETTTGLTATLNTDKTATLTATVSAGVAPVTTGTVEFYEGTTKLDEQPVSGSGVAAHTTVQALAAGNHSFTAKYVPAAADYAPSQSAPQTVSVTGPAAPATTTALTAALATATTATLTATVTTAGGTITNGKVEFFEGTTSLGERPVASGAASLTTAALEPGHHVFTASYIPAGSTYAPSTSTDASVTVAGEQVEGTSLAFTADSGITSSGDPTVALKAGVLQDGSAEDSAEGTVQFFRDDAELGDPIEVDGGIASLLDDKAAGLKFDTRYEYRAEFTPAEGSELDPAESHTLTISVKAPVALTSGMTVTAGATYLVTAPDGTFTAGETVKGEVRSTPISVGSGTATAGGGLAFTFKMPSGLAPGAHSLVLTGSTSGATRTVAFSVAAGGPNPSANFATEWAAQMSSSPTILIALFSALLVLASLGVLGWNLFWRRRGAQATTDE